MCESGPCHWSRGREGVYLAAVLGLAATVSVVWSERNYRDDDFSGVLKIRQLVRLILVCRTVQRLVLPGPQPGFFRRAAGREAARAGAAPSVRAQRKAAQLSGMVAEMLGKPGPAAGPSVADRLLEPVLLSLLMLEDVMWAFRDLSQALQYPLLAVMVLLPLLMVRQVVKRWCRLRTLAMLVHELIVDIIDHRAADVLQHVLLTVSVGSLVEVLRWDTVTQLTERALDENLLCTVSKAVLVDALQMRGIRFKRKAQHAVRCLILSCKGEHLTMLKNLIDGSGGYHNLHKLVYFDFTNSAWREELLLHFAEEAARARAQLGRAAGVKVLSDIDDTLCSSGGLFPAGCDRSFPRHAVYPGLLSLLKVLDRAWSPTAPSCNLVFLSARPHLYKDLAEDRSYRRFQELVEAGRMHSFPTLLPGRLFDGVWAVVAAPFVGARAWRRVGQRKFRTYQQFQRLYQEYDFIFCGDNGQGDLLAGQMMLQDQVSAMASSGTVSQGPRLLCVLIHRVLPDRSCLAKEAPVERGERWREQLWLGGLIVHSSYVGAAAALHSYDPQLVSAEQLAEVAAAAVDEFDAARWAFARWRRHWGWAEHVLRRDLDRANGMLVAQGLAPLPRLRGTRELLHERRSSWSLGSGSTAPTPSCGARGDPHGLCECEGCDPENLDTGRASEYSEESGCSPASGVFPSMPTMLLPSSPAANTPQPAAPGRLCLSWCSSLLKG